MNTISLKEIKHQFFTYRNGIIADTMHQAGDKHPTIFGLGIPQIKDIAKGLEKNKDLATALWENDTCRESQILACYIYPTDEFSLETAHKWIDEIPNVEIADILCHALLRYTSYAESLLHELISDKESMSLYTGLRLLKNLIVLRTEINLAKAENALSKLPEQLPTNYINLIKSIKDDIEFYSEN